ncbi:hypothetical protein J6590_057481 [Homalodisca vitripennis]|nr:hypothetical protein J6590_057481 [Homalodisca vitripennis]
MITNVHKSDINYVEDVSQQQDQKSTSEDDLLSEEMMDPSCLCEVLLYSSDSQTDFDPMPNTLSGCYINELRELPQELIGGEGPEEEEEYILSDNGDSIFANMLRIQHSREIEHVPSKSDYVPNFKPADSSACIPVDVPCGKTENLPSCESAPETHPLTKTSGFINIVPENSSLCESETYSSCRAETFPIIKPADVLNSKEEALLSTERVACNGQTTMISCKSNPANSKRRSRSSRKSKISPSNKRTKRNLLSKALSSHESETSPDKESADVTNPSEALLSCKPEIFSSCIPVTSLVKPADAINPIAETLPSIELEHFPSCKLESTMISDKSGTSKPKSSKRRSRSRKSKVYSSKRRKVVKSVAKALLISDPKTSPTSIHAEVTNPSEVLPSCETEISPSRTSVTSSIIKPADVTNLMDGPLPSIDVEKVSSCNLEYNTISCKSETSKPSNSKRRRRSSRKSKIYSSKRRKVKNSVSKALSSNDSKTSPTSSLTEVTNPSGVLMSCEPEITSCCESETLPSCKPVTSIIKPSEVINPILETLPSNEKEELPASNLEATVMSCKSGTSKPVQPKRRTRSSYKLEISSVNKLTEATNLVSDGLSCSGSETFPDNRPMEVTNAVSEALSNSGPEIILDNRPMEVTNAVSVGLSHSEQETLSDNRPMEVTNLVSEVLSCVPEVYPVNKSDTDVTNSKQNALFSCIPDAGLVMEPDKTVEIKAEPDDENTMEGKENIYISNNRQENYKERQMLPLCERRILMVLLHRLEDGECRLCSNKNGEISPFFSAVKLRLPKPKKKHKKSSADYKTCFNRYRKFRKCVCKKMFMNDTLLKAHQQSKTCFRFQCRGCLRRFNKQEKLDEHVASKCETVKVFSCNVCNRRYLYKRELVRHMTPVCQTLRTFKCDYCPKKFLGNEKRRKHMRIHGVGIYQRSFLCEFCGKLLSSSPYRFREHVLTHSDETSFFCSTCGKGFKSRRGLRTHATTHSEERPFKCAECHNSFKTLKQLKDHLAVHGMGYSHICKVCGKGLNKKSLYEKHVRMHEIQNIKKEEVLNIKACVTHDCNQCGKSFKRRDLLRQHLLVHNDVKPHECKICGTSLKYANSMKRHMLMHLKKSVADLSDSRVPHIKKELPDDKKPEICNECGKAFASKEALKLHSTAHMKERPFSCEVCKMSFKTRVHLNQHMVVHSDVKPNKCNICGKVFTKSRSLKLHALTHTDERPYPCQICGTLFKSQDHVKRHMMVHTKSNPFLGIENTDVTEMKEETMDVKPLLCNVCGKSFTSRLKLRLHSLVHTDDRPFPCSVCGVKFKARFYLRRHMLVHSKTTTSEEQSQAVVKKENVLLDKPYVCNTCGESFMSHENLNLHSLIHKIEQPVVCAMCGALFESNHQLVQHMAVHSEEVTSADTEVPVQINTEEDKATHMCSECGQSFISIENLKDHFLTHFDLKVPTVAEVEKSENNLLKAYLLKKNSHESNTSESTQILHQNNYISNGDSIVRPFKCDLCTKSYRRKSDLDRHMLVHGLVKPGAISFKCSDCGKLFGAKYKYEHHLKTHSGEKPFHCDQCGKNFKEKYSLQRHQQTHADQRQIFSCNICKVGFYKLQSLRHHMNKVHGMSSDVVDPKFEFKVESIKEENLEDAELPVLHRLQNVAVHERGYSSGAYFQSSFNTLHNEMSIPGVSLDLSAKTGNFRQQSSMHLLTMMTDFDQGKEELHSIKTESLIDIQHW